MAKKIVGVFDSDQEAVSAIHKLKESGFAEEEISVIAKNRDDVPSISRETGTKVSEGAITGAVTGGLLGGAGGFIAGLGAMALPGIGPFLAAGPIAAAVLGGAAAGAGAGGLVGSLVGLGIPEEDAREYESDFLEGHILVMVDAEEDSKAAVSSIFKAHRSRNADRYQMDDEDDNKRGPNVGYGIFGGITPNDTVTPVLSGFSSDTTTLGVDSVEDDQTDGSRLGDSENAEDDPDEDIDTDAVAEDDSPVDPVSPPDDIVHGTDLLNGAGGEDSNE